MRDLDARFDLSDVPRPPRRRSRTTERPAHTENDLDSVLRELEQERSGRHES
ncbi:MAG: hypothetical protein JO257_37075 [Deltaproteobacteria bacterium]|nr:hypothetical protein [Deltaproteobacteria bacterium]